MAVADSSPSPPAAGSITVNTGPVPSSRVPVAADVDSSEKMDGDREATTEPQEPASGADATAASTSQGRTAAADEHQVDDGMEGVIKTTTTAPEDAGPAAAGGSGGLEPPGSTTTPTTTTTTTAGGTTTATATSQDVAVARGAFVVFEGLDRAGKTTQAKLLQQRCIESGRNVKYMRFPDRTTPIGQMIDAYLRGETETEDHVIHLLFSANRWEAINRIKADLAAGTTIICDRYYHSGIVYSAAKQLPSLSLSWARAPEVGLPRPDLVLFLDLEESVARSRGGWGGEVYERGEMQRRVRELFWGLSMGDLSSSKSKSGSGRKTSETTTAAQTDTAAATGGNVSGIPGGTGSTMVHEFRQEEEDIQIVDANLGVEELSDKVWSVVIPRVEAVERGEVGRTVRVVQ